LDSDTDLVGVWSAAHNIQGEINRALAVVVNVTGRDFVAGLDHHPTDFDEQDVSDAEAILVDTYRVWTELQQPSFLPTDVLLGRLLELEDSRWHQHRGGKLTTRSLAILLEAYGVKPFQKRLSDRVARGYDGMDLKRALDRYCTVPEQPAQPAQVLRLAAPGRATDNISESSR
jgi:hypothetical protein